MARKFSEAEIDKRGRQLAKVLEKYAREMKDQAETKSAMKERLREIQEQIDALTFAVNKGEPYKPEQMKIAGTEPAV